MLLPAVSLKPSVSLPVAAAALLAALLAAVPVDGTNAAPRDHKNMSPAMAVTKGGITVSGPWARASAGRAANGAAYFTLANEGLMPDRLKPLMALAPRRLLEENR